MMVGSEEAYTEADVSLQRMQDFDVNRLPRQEHLGGELNFSAAKAPAQILVDLWKRLSPSALQDFPDQQLNTVKTQADNHYKILDQILKFEIGQTDPKAARQTLLKQLEAAYQPTFQQLHPLISYSLHRSADFQRLDSEARATLQSIQDRADSFSQEMKGHQDDASRILDEIRNVAAEEGVTQQAAHFRAEADEHSESAETWRGRTVNIAIAIGVFAVFSIFLHKIPWIAPDTTSDTVQLALSKILIFGIMFYMLYLSSRNFLGHKHNTVVNRHRQNALMTHRALIEATSEPGIREAIVLQAATSIFSPQSTGYSATKGENEAPNARSVVEILTKPVASSIGQNS